MRVLIICTSQDLPTKIDRDPNTIYFVFDKMMIYLGRNVYTDPFCVVEDFPELKYMVDGMLYINFAGSVKTRFGDRMEDIGEIEDPAQLDYIKDIGTTYFMNAESRYLDLQTRTIQLPFQNGSFQLSVSLMKDLQIDKDTVIYYDPDQSKFVIGGNIAPTDYPANINHYKGATTSTIKTTIRNNTVRSDVVVSPNPNNMIKVFGNGIYIDNNTKMDATQFSALRTAYLQYKTQVDSYIEELRTTIENSGIEVSDQSIAEKIASALEEYAPNIDTIIARYEEIEAYLTGLETQSKSYADEQVAAVKSEIINYLDNIVEAWGGFDVSETDAPPQNDLTTDELILKATLLEKFREYLVITRKIAAGEPVDLDGYFVLETEDDLEKFIAQSFNVPEFPVDPDTVTDDEDPEGDTTTEETPTEENSENQPSEEESEDSRVTGGETV